MISMEAATYAENFREVALGLGEKMALLDDLEQLRAAAVAAFAAATDAKAMEAARVEYLGSRGKLKALLGRMGEIPKEDRPVTGKRANELSAEIHAAFEAARERLGIAPPPQPAKPAPASQENESRANKPVPQQQATKSSLEVLKQERLEKLKKYEDKMGAGAAWGGRFPDTVAIEEIRKKFPLLKEGETPSHENKIEGGKIFRLAARVMLRRDQSKKLIFLTVQDQGAQIQVALWNQLLPEEIPADKTSASLPLLRETLDLWDILGIEGELAYTQRGEPTVWATSVKILSKCLAPPPDKFHGLHDKELRYRQRYLDLITNPDSRKTFILRAKAVSRVRSFLDGRGFLEMETPVLQTIPGGAAARPFETKLNALDMRMYMRIATEIPLKKLMVGGLEKVYELGRIFRNEGIDARHNPEFTTVEVYQAYADLRDMMALTETLVSGLAQELTGSTTVQWRGKPVKLGAPWPRLDYSELMRKYASVETNDSSGLVKKLLERGISAKDMSLVERIDTVFSEYCEEHLQDACFVINQPIEMSPLCKALAKNEGQTDFSVTMDGKTGCKAHPGSPKLADRFETFAAGMEIANAYSELNDSTEQRRRLETQNRKDWGYVLRTAKVGKSGELFNQLNALLLKIEGLADGLPPKSWSDEAHEVLKGAESGQIGPEVKRMREKLEAPENLIDKDFLNALDHAMPPAGGLGIGIDRVVMLLANADSIRDVIPFPLMRPEGT